MQSGNQIGLIVVLFLAIGVGLLFEFAKAQDAKSVPIPLSEVLSRSLLSPGSQWDVVILRRSGYVHDAWKIDGSKAAAINSAISKLRQAKLEVVEIVQNDARRMEVRAYYESGGSRRTGKYIGGFVITPCV